MDDRKTGQRWTKTSVQGLVRHSSGTYYARLFAAGKERWRSLRTTVLEVAKNRLRDEQRTAVGEPVKPTGSGRMVMATAIATLEAEIAAGTPMRGHRKRHNQESSRSYRRQTLIALRKSWNAVNGTDLATLEVRRVTTEVIERWADAYRTTFLRSASIIPSALCVTFLTSLSAPARPTAIPQHTSHGPR